MCKISKPYSSQSSGLSRLHVLEDALSLDLIAVLQPKLAKEGRDIPRYLPVSSLAQSLMPVDVTGSGSLFRDPIATEALISTFLSHLFLHTIPKLQGKKIDMVVGLDARGFLFGPLIALRLGAGFAPVRKAGKLPGTVNQATYVKEYGEDTFEMQHDALSAGQNVIVVDDLMATGGSAYAAGQLVKEANATVVEYLFCIELPFLKGREKLSAPVWSLIQADD